MAKAKVLLFPKVTESITRAVELKIYANALMSAIFSPPRLHSVEWVLLCREAERPLLRFLEDLPMSVSRALLAVAWVGADPPDVDDTDPPDVDDADPPDVDDADPPDVGDDFYSYYHSAGNVYRCDGARIVAKYLAGRIGFLLSGWKRLGGRPKINWKESAPRPNQD